MRYTDAKLSAIYERTEGYCHLCHTKLSYSNYGINGMRGAWHVEHSIPKARGGSDHLNNLYAACINCNLEKGTKSNQTMRRRNGASRAPYSKRKVERLKEDYALSGMLAGVIAGMKYGPGGALLGAFIGALIGEDISPRR